LRWALFKDNLSFPGNVRVGDLLSELLQIEFDLSDSLFQGFVFVWHMSFLSGLAYYREVDSLLRAECPVALPACYSVVTDTFDSIGKALLSKGEIWQIIAGLLCQIISKMIDLHQKGRMPEQQTFLSMITGSFSTPAAENPTVAMIEAAYEHHHIDARYLNCDVILTRSGSERPFVLN